MFNQPFKEGFIKTAASKLYREKQLAALFRFTEQFETAAGKDLYEFERDELSAVARGITDGIQSAQQKISDLRAYLHYAELTGAARHDPAYDVLQVPDERALRSVYFANAFHLQTTLNAYYEPESAGSFDNLYRLVYWLAFAGVYENDLYCIRREDVDVETRIVTLDGRVYRLQKEALKCLAFCKASEYFCDVMSGAERQTRREHSRAPGNLLLRGSGARTSIDVLRATISRRNRVALAENCELHPLSYRDVWRSGLFTRAADRQMAGIPVDFAEVALEIARRKGANRGKGTIQRSASTGERVLRMEYERWKAAFRPEQNPN